MTGALFRRLVIRLVRRRAFLFLVVLGVLLGGGFLAFRALSPDGGAGLGIALPGGSDPKAIDAFLQGNRSYDAELVWNAYSPDAQERLRARGAGLEDLKRQLTVAKERGTRIDEAKYVGAHQLPDGSTMHFYVLRVSNPVLQAQAQTQSPGSASTQTVREFVPYAFTVDASGKISRVQ